MEKQTLLKQILLGLAMLACFFGAYAQTPTGPSLAQQYGCLNCHNVEQKMVGPAYKSVSEKYQADTIGATPLLIQKIKNGGAGNWGRIPMPANPNVSDADLKTLVTWILSLK